MLILTFGGEGHYHKKKKKTLQLRDGTFCRNPSSQAVCDTPIARITRVCILIKDVGRRLPLELQQRSLYQGQQGDGDQSVRENCETRY